MGSMAGNAMVQPVISGFSRYFSPTLARDPYTALRRPNYMAFGPNQQFYQPIYQPSYSQFSPANYGPGPFGGFYQQPQQNMFGPATDISDQGQAALRQMPQPMLSPQPMQQQYAPAQMQQPSSQSTVRRGFRALSGQQPSSFPYSVNYGAPMLSPQPMQSQYRPIPIASQTSIDQLVSQARSEGMSEGQAAAQSAFANSGGGAKAGGKVHEEGIDSLLKK